MTKISEKKDETYFRHVRYDLLPFVPRDAKRILDIGCGAGETAAVIKNRLHVEEIIGIEIDKKIAEEARTKLDSVLVGDIEVMPLNFPANYFDCILCADILEHLIDPWNMLKKIRTYLSSNGVLIASIPNIRHITVILDILLDRWRYQDEGILDKTHLRFFTLSTIKSMFDEAGYTIIKLTDNYSRSLKFKLLHLFSLGFMRQFSIVQYIVVAQKRAITPR